MWKDEIVEEVRRVRREYAARFDFDLEAIAEDLRRKDRESGREVVSLPPKLLQGPPGNETTR